MEKYINPYTDLDWDIANGMEAAEKKGIEKGRAEGAHAQAVETTRRLKAKGTMSVAEIADLLGLTSGEISSL